MAAWGKMKLVPDEITIRKFMNLIRASEFDKRDN